MGRGLHGVGIISILVFLGVACSSEPRLDIPVEERIEGKQYMTIDKDAYVKDRAGPVQFTHDRHFEEYGVECKECHHLYDEGENVWTEDDPVDTCESCHDPAYGSDGVYRLEAAFHHNCRGCHQKVNEEKGETGPPAAPVLCQGCHEVH
jgi:predicted CXXCH cytochrome family protein